MFLHIKVFKTLSHCVFSFETSQSFFIFIASSLGVLYWGSWRFFFSSFHNRSFFSFLLACSCACFTCLLRMFISFTYFTNLISLFYLPCVLGSLLPLSVCHLLSLPVCYFVYLVCLPCLHVLAYFAYLVCLFHLPTLSFASRVGLPLTLSTSLLLLILACSHLFCHLLLLTSLALFVLWLIHACSCFFCRLFCCLLHCLFCHLLPPWSLLWVFRLLVLHLLLLALSPTCLLCYFLV